MPVREALHDTDRAFQLLFQQHPQPMWVYDPDSLRFLDVNEAAVALYGYDRSAFHRMRITDIRPAAELHRLDVNLQQPRPPLQAAGRWQHRLQDGRVIDVEITSHTVTYGGRPAVLVLITDVTEHHVARRALDRREAELSFLADASALLASSLDYERTLQTLAELAVPQIADWCAVHIVDEDGQAQELAVAHTDPGKVEMVRTLQRQYPPDPGQESGMRRAVRAREPVIYSQITDEMLAASARDPEHLALMRAIQLHAMIIVPLIARERVLGALTLVAAESRHQFDDHDLALAQDLAHRAAATIDNARLYRERLIAEDALRTLNVELEERVRQRTAQVMAANAELEAFAYSVSHDLRAPLRSIDGFSKILADRYASALDERGLRYLDHVRGAAQEMAQLIDALLRLARLTRSAMHWEQVDLSALVRSIGATVGDRDPTRDVAFSCADHLVVHGDPELLGVLMENLLANAWKFTRDRTPAVISVGKTVNEQDEVYFVRDNGAGFDPRYAHKLFGPFQRLHAVTEFEGTGIGLATAQRIVHRHGGRIWAEGQVGVGATFFFTLRAR